jgi:hypothetical protein
MNHKCYRPAFFILLFVLLLSACGGAGDQPVLTTYPKYAPVEMVGLNLSGIQPPAPDSCQVRSVDLIGAWVGAKTPETDPFPFSDVNGKTCQGTFSEDVLPIFTQANFWYEGAPSCRTCHGQDVATSYARLDMGTYPGILAGSSRASADTQGEDILGGGNWEQSKLYKQLVEGDMPPNRPASVDPKGPLIYAGISQ